MTDDLALAYKRCQSVHRAHGRTYYLATRLLPAWKRQHVHALYGFTRFADEIVDQTADLPHAERDRRLADWASRFQAGLRGERVNDPILPAVLDTIEVFGLDRGDFTLFLDSMRMDLDVVSYPDYAALLSYMEGSAAVIGTMMLPILGSADPAAAREPARQLGFAFQLTNFIRDVAEDLDRGRVYLPESHLAHFGVTRPDLMMRVATPAVKALIKHEIAVAREHYAAAAPGVTMLDPPSQACIRTAYHLYGAILNEVERADYDVFAGRAKVAMGRRLRVAMRCLTTPAGTPVVTGSPGA
jgi:phytoene synthase